MLEKIDNLRKQLAEKFPIEDNAEQEAQNNVPDLEDVSKFSKVHTDPLSRFNQPTEIMVRPLLTSVAPLKKIQKIS